MNKKDDNDSPPTLQKGLGFGDALAADKARENVRRRIVRRKDVPPLTQQQEELLAQLLFGTADFGKRKQTGLFTLRLGETLDARFNAFLEAFPSAQKKKLVEFALDRFLQELGF